MTKTALGHFKGIKRERMSLYGVVRLPYQNLDGRRFFCAREKLEKS